MQQKNLGHPIISWYLSERLNNDKWGPPRRSYFLSTSKDEARRRKCKREWFSGFESAEILLQYTL